MQPMAKKPAPVTRIGQRPRRHFIREWMESREPPVQAADLVRADVADKSTVSRWMGGQMPQDAQLEKLGAYFQVDPESLLRHPDDDWMTRFFEGRAKAERDGIKKMLEQAFPPKTGTR